METAGVFELDGVLGEGGSAIVYAARRTDGVRRAAIESEAAGSDAAKALARDVLRSVPHAEDVALKVLRPELMLSEREVGAFLEEAHRAQRVRHPSLIEIVDAGVLPDGRPYLAMPRLRGECLAERVMRGPFAVETALRLFRGLGEAIGTLHSAGLVHRDIKPENVFLVGAEDHLVLLDLGIARDIDAPASTTTQAGLVRGTPAYMAPERFFGARASTLTDTYEAAVLLYVMLAARLPWDHAQEARGRMSPRDPRTVVPLPEPLALALLRALSVDETVRPQSMAAFLDDLEHAAISTADTKISPALLVPTLASPGVVRVREPAVANALSAPPPPPGDISTQDTIAVSTGRDVRPGAERAERRAPSWAPAVLAACVLAGGAAAAWTFLVPRGSNGGAESSPAASSIVAGSASAGAGSARADAIGSGATAAPAGAAASGEPQASAATNAATATKGAAGSTKNTTSTTGATAAGATSSAAPANKPVSTPVPAAPPIAASPAAAAAPHLADCMTLLALYCAPDFKATDGGTTCSQWSVNIHGYRLQPKETWPALNGACKSAMHGALLTLHERKRQLAAGKAPGRTP